MADLHFDTFSTQATSLTVDSSPSAMKMESVDPLTPWSYCPPYTSSFNTIEHDASLDFLQPYDLDNWSEQSQPWQNMLDNWMQPKHEEEQKLDLLALPSVSLPPTPPNHSPNTSYDFDFLNSLLPSRDATPPPPSTNLGGGIFSSSPYVMNNNPSIFNPQSPTFMATPSSSTSLSSSSASSLSSTSNGSLSSSSLCSSLLSLPSETTDRASFGGKHRRRASDHPPSRMNKPYKRRASCHPSVASVVSLTAHEPISNYINGVEHITFLYTHERLVKEYTVCADVDSVDLNSIPESFKSQNTIYPRANVERNKYDGNRWEYETTCNTLGWKLCWLNQDQLCGRRGLIQRTVDSYRNRHAEMRSRRVTRQEKVANGTLRKRKSRKSIVPPLM